MRSDEEKGNYIQSRPYPLRCLIALGAHGKMTFSLVIWLVRNLVIDVTLEKDCGVQLLRLSMETVVRGLQYTSRFTCI